MFFATFFLAGVLLSLALNLFIHIPAKEKALSFSEFEGNVTGEIVSINHKEYYDRIVIKTKTIGEEKVRLKVIFFSESTELCEGEIISLDGTLSSISSNSLTYNSKKHNESEKIYLQMKAEKVESTDLTPNFFKKWIFELRQNCAENFVMLDNTNLLKELVLGMSGSIDAQTNKDFKKLGISHALSVSGMHLSIIVMSLYSLLREQNLEKKSVSVLCSIITFLYMALTGFSFSIVRAGIMMIVYFSSAMFRRKPDTLTSLFAAGLFICAENPNAIFDVGFELSFLATLGIVTLGSKTIKAISKTRFFNMTKRHVIPLCCTKVLLKIILAFVINTSALLFTTPIILLYYGSITPLSFIANISVLFLINLLLIISFIYQTLSFLNIGFLGAVVNFLSNTVLACTSRLAKALPDPVSYSPEFSFIAAIVLTVALIISLCVFSKKNTLLFTCISVSLSLIVLQGVFFTVRQNTTYITLSTSTPSYNLLAEENGQKSFVSLDYKDLSASSIYTITAYRNVSSIDTALFFIKEKIPTKSIGALLESANVDKIIITSLDDIIYDWQKREIEKLVDGACDIDYINFSEYQVSDSVLLEKMSGEYISVQATEQNTTVTLTYLFGKEFLLPTSYFENSDGIVLFGYLDYLPPFSPRHFYLYSSENEIFSSNKAQNITNTEFAFIKVSEKGTKFKSLK